MTEHVEEAVNLATELIGAREAMDFTPTRAGGPYVLNILLPPEGSVLTRSQAAKWLKEDHAVLVDFLHRSREAADLCEELTVDLFAEDLATMTRACAEALDRPCDHVEIVGASSRERGRSLTGRAFTKCFRTHWLTRSGRKRGHASNTGYIGRLPVSFIRSNARTTDLRAGRTSEF